MTACNECGRVIVVVGDMPDFVCGNCQLLDRYTPDQDVDGEVPLGYRAAYQDRCANLRQRHIPTPWTPEDRQWPVGRQYSLLYISPWAGTGGKGTAHLC